MWLRRRQKCLFFPFSFEQFFYILSRFCGAAVHNGHIYVVGGIDENGTRLNTVECLDGDRWRVSKASMNRIRSSPSLVEYDGILFAIGGRIGSKSFENSFEVLQEVKRNEI